MKYEILIGSSEEPWQKGDIPYSELKELVLDLKHPEKALIKPENFIFEGATFSIDHDTKGEMTATIVLDWYVEAECID